jgi:SAM-dependent methyltransferase
MSVVDECRQAVRYWFREVLGGMAYRRRLKQLGIDISSVPLSRLGLDHSRAHNHANSGGPDLELVLRELGIGPEHSILDLGCGKGGALLTMARFPFRRIAGLDLSSEMISIARANMGRLDGVSERVELIEGDAARFADYDDFTHVYMYNPFPREVMRCALDMMEASLVRRPRTLTIIYKNPRFHDEIVRSGVFVETRRFDHSGHPFVVYVGGMNGTDRTNGTDRG